MKARFEPAFPLANSHPDLEHTNWSPANGMSLRDYFAAKAMQAMIAHRYKIGDFTNGDSAEEAFGVADAMLRAREAP